MDISRHDKFQAICDEKTSGNRHVAGAMENQNEGAPVQLVEHRLFCQRERQEARRSGGPLIVSKG